MGLPWIRMDTNFSGNDKVTDLIENYGPKGKQAGFVYLCALGYAGAYETDGLIKKSSLKFVHGTPADAAILVAAGFWEVVDAGWMIRNYGSRQVLGAAQQALSQTRSEAGKKGSGSTMVRLMANPIFAIWQTHMAVSDLPYGHAVARTERTYVTDLRTLPRLGKTPYVSYPAGPVDNRVPRVAEWPKFLNTEEMAS